MYQEIRFEAADFDKYARNVVISKNVVLIFSVKIWNNHYTECKYYSDSLQRTDT